MNPTLTNICLVALALILFGAATYIMGYHHGKPKFRRESNGRFTSKRRTF